MKGLLLGYYAGPAKDSAQLTNHKYNVLHHGCYFPNGHSLGSGLCFKTISIFVFESPVCQT